MTMNIPAIEEYSANSPKASGVKSLAVTTETVMAMACDPAVPVARMPMLLSTGWAAA